MAFDVSFHPVPVNLIQNRLLPYVAGEGDIDDLVADAVRLAKVRFRAKAWGFGVLDVHEAPDRKRKGGKTKGKKSSQPTWKQRFHSDVHVWGRPFFITLARPDQVSRAIDRYLAAQPDAVDALAAEMINLLDPKLLNQVEPDEEGKLPDDDVLAQNIRQPLDLFRDCYQVRPKNKRIKLPNGETATPQQLFQHNFALSVLTFAAHFRPGWMARGDVWPTRLLADRGLKIQPFFDTAAALFQPILAKVPEITASFEGTITQNHMVGGYIPPDRVSDFRLLLEDHRDEFEGDEAIGFQKIYEATVDAEREKMAFAEAAEVYNGPRGIMN